MVTLVTRPLLRQSPLINHAYDCPAALSMRRVTVAMELLDSLEASLGRRIEAFSRVHDAVSACPDLFFPAERLPQATLDPEAYPLVLRPEARLDLDALLSQLRRDGIAAYPILQEEPLRSWTYPPPHRKVGKILSPTLRAAAILLTAMGTRDDARHLEAVLRRASGVSPA
jgi:hypothetical protein